MRWCWGSWLFGHFDVSCLEASYSKIKVSQKWNNSVVQIYFTVRQDRDGTLVGTRATVYAKCKHDDPRRFLKIP